MNIALIEVKPRSQDYIAKEMAAGLGKRIRLGNNPFSALLNKSLTSFFSAPPLALAQVAGVAQSLGHSLKAYHTSDAALIAPDTGLAVVLSSMVDCRNEVDFIRQLKKQLPSAKVVVVGSFAAAMPEVYASSADVIIKGDPEKAFENILRNGIEARGVVHEELADLSRLPMLDWTPFIQNGYYARRPFSRDLGVSIQKSRGCSMTCNYCPYAAFYGKARQFDAEHTLKTIRHYHDRHNIRYFMFRDPNFGENRKDFHVFMEKLIALNVRINWSCEARLDTFKDEDFPLMHRAGLRYIITGVESSNEELLKENMRRAYKKDDTFRKIQVLEKAGVVVQTNFILGFPKESQESVRATIDYAKALNSMFATFHIFTPQPGTKVFDNYRDKLLDVNWEDFSYSNLVWKHDTLSKEFLEKSVSSAYTEYYFRPRWILKHLPGLAKLVCQ